MYTLNVYTTTFISPIKIKIKIKILCDGFLFLQSKRNSSRKLYRKRLSMCVVDNLLQYNNFPSFYIVCEVNLYRYVYSTFIYIYIYTISNFIYNFNYTITHTVRKITEMNYIGINFIYSKYYRALI